MVYGTPEAEVDIRIQELIESARAAVQQTILTLLNERGGFERNASIYLRLRDAEAELCYAIDELRCRTGRPPSS